MAFSDLRVPNGRQWLRHFELPGDRTGIRHARRFQPAYRRSEEPRHRHCPRPRRQSYIGRTSLVHRSPQIDRQPLPRLLHLAEACRRRWFSEHFDILFWRAGLDAGSSDGRILFASLLPPTARLELGERKSQGKNLPNDELVAGTWHCWISYGRHRLHRQAGRPVDHHGRPPSSRLSAGDAPRDLRQSGRPDDRRDLERDARLCSPLLGRGSSRTLDGVSVRACDTAMGRDLRQMAVSAL